MGNQVFFAGDRAVTGRFRFRRTVRVRRRQAAESVGPGFPLDARN